MRFDKAHAVINYLGISTLITIVGAIWLVHEAVVSPNQIDPAAVALIGGIVSINTLTIGGLIGMVVGKQMAKDIMSGVPNVE